MTSLDLIIEVKNNYSELIISPGIDSDKKNFIYKSVIKIATGSYIHFYKTERVKKEILLYNNGFNLIPTGLLNSFVELIKDIISFDYRDQREFYPAVPIPIKFPYDLDDKQKEAIEVGLENRRGYFKAATGAGKTSIIAALIAEIGGPSLVLVPWTDLTDQIAKDLEEFLNIPIWKIQGKESLYCPPDTDVAVASIDTLWANIDLLKIEGWFNQFHSVYADECHHISYTKERVKRDGRKIIKRSPPGVTLYYSLLMECKAFNRFGFTATDEDSELYIEAALGQKLIDIDEDYLISTGRLSKPYVIIYRHKIPFYDNEREATKQTIYLNEERNLILINAMRIITEMGGSVLFMLDSKKYQLDQIENWTHFPILTGDSSNKDRIKVYDQLRNKEISGIILTIGKEGLNIPSVDCIIRASGKKSIRLIKQEKGRGARIAPNKNRYIIIDTFDDDGFQKIRREDGKWRTKKGYMSKQSQERLDIYSSIKSAEITIVDSFELLAQRIKEVF